MATLSFHAPDAVERKIRAAARRRGVKVSRYLLSVSEQAAAGAPVSDLGRELEKLALDGMALAALARIRARVEAADDKQASPAKIRAAIKAARAARA